MLMLSGTLLLAALQQGSTSPPSGDTVTYWQQRVHYTITATLDERAARVQARGTMRYVNNSPDTLREMFVHQYLNAFRPASAWSRTDDKEGRERFQHLQDPEYGYERFTAPVRVDGRAVVVAYPGAPDSTVARFALPAALAPGDSVLVSFEWDARPSTLPRRQGRRLRQWDLAQWYPKVAVYDRSGWQSNALRPAGEFYGEFGTYDVTLVVADDQVLGATGVPVSGDPGWSRARRAGVVFGAERAYPDVAAASTPDRPAGYKAVRFYARDVHHFAWSASPDYRYEGGIYVRIVPAARWPTWDTVAVHALYRAGDDTTWGGLRVVQRTINAMRWLESVYGPYAYPQMTVLHRLDGGGTEFPMMQMNGSPSQGLILHEGGHVWTYGILANNEWRSGWMDEGLTSYQTEWAQGFTPQERLRAGIVAQFAPPTGYRARAISLAATRFDAFGLERTLTDLRGEAQPIGTVAHAFRDFGTYNDMIYNRAQVMYGQLRDLLGDSLWIDFLHDYYARWALRHVDERAMRASAERVSGRALGWFFDQWVRHTGVVDYALTDVRTARQGAGWLSEATIRRRGAYRHPMTVGVRTAAGWTLGRIGDTPERTHVVRIVTTDEPLEVRLDPHHFSWDWDRRNDVERSRPRPNVDWPFLRQADRQRSVLLLRPMVWYSEPGGATVGARVRSSYLGELDGWQAGVAYAARPEVGATTALQYWARLENPYLPFLSRPAMGWSAGAAKLDDVARIDLSHRRETARRRRTDVATYGASFSYRTGTRLLPEFWTARSLVDLHVRARTELERDAGYWFFDGSIATGFADRGGYHKSELAAGRVLTLGEKSSVGIRGYSGVRFGKSVGQRALFLSAEDPITTFGTHWWRPSGSVLKQDGLSFLPLGGAALRGFHWRQTIDVMALAVNLDASWQLSELQRSSSEIAFRLHAFVDAAPAAYGPSGIRERLTDAGLGVSGRGRLYDRPIHVRLDAPVFVSHPPLAIDGGRGTRRVAPRWLLTFNDIW